MMARDAPTCHLGCHKRGLSGLIAAPASVNSPRLRRFNHSVLTEAVF